MATKKRGSSGLPRYRLGAGRLPGRLNVKPSQPIGGTRTTPARTPAASMPTAPAVPTAGTSIPQTATAFSGGAGSYDPNTDPAVAAAHGLAEKIRANAQASALAKRVQAALEYGDPTGVSGLTDEQAKAARENPFSVLQNLEHNYQTGTRDLNEGLNKANLFYSGYRGQQLGEAARGYQGSKYAAGTAFKGLQTDIGDQLSQALLQADMYEQQALLGSSGGSYDPGGSDSGTSYSSNADLFSALRGTPTNRGPVTYQPAAPKPPPLPSSLKVRISPTLKTGW